MKRPLPDGALLALSIHALQAQHQAIDLLLALLLERDKTFRPTQAVPIWKAVEDGHNLINLLRQRMPKVP